MDKNLQYTKTGNTQWDSLNEQNVCLSVWVEKNQLRNVWRSEWKGKRTDGHGKRRRRGLFYKLCCLPPPPNYSTTTLLWDNLHFFPKTLNWGLDKSVGNGLEQDGGRGRGRQLSKAKGGRRRRIHQDLKHSKFYLCMAAITNQSWYAPKSLTIFSPLFQPKQIYGTGV